MGFKGDSSSKADDTKVFLSSKGGSLTADDIDSMPAPTPTALATAESTTALVKIEDSSSASTGQTSPMTPWAKVWHLPTERRVEIFKTPEGKEFLDGMMTGRPYPPYIPQSSSSKKADRAGSTSTGSTGDPKVKEEDYSPSKADDTKVFSSSKGGSLTADDIDSKPARVPTALETPGLESTALVKKEDLSPAFTGQTSSINSDIPARNNKVSKKPRLVLSARRDRIFEWDDEYDDEDPPHKSAPRSFLASSANWEALSQQKTDGAGRTSTGSTDDPKVKEEDDS